MYYHLNDHVYITQFREEFILLDTKKDKYVIYSKRFSELLAKFFEISSPSLEDKSIFSSQGYSQDSAFIKKLLDDKIIVGKTTHYPFYIDRKDTSTGVSNVDWRLPLNNKKISFNFSVLTAFFALLKVNYYMKVKGLYSTIQMIKMSKNDQSQYVIPQEENLKNLANVVNKACLIYPTRTKCLEWAMTFVLLALKEKWKCNLEIGIQNYPFFAHAWVECDGKIVMDLQELRQGLAIVLNEPFRKLAI